MAVQPSGGGFQRTTNLPTNAAGWAMCFWFRRTGSVSSGLNETLFEIVDNGDGDFIKLQVNDAHNLEFLGVNDFEQVTLFNVTLNTWYFFALRTTSATAGDALWRTDSATSLTSSTGRKFQTDNGWDAMYFLNNANGLEPADHFEAFCFKMWVGTLSDAQLWEQSVRMLPKAQGAALDSYLPLYAASGTDESGRARNWTVNATVNEVKAQPRISRGGARARVSRPAAAPAGETLLMPLLATTAGLAAPSLLARVSLPLLAVTAGLSAPSAAAQLQVPQLGVTAGLPVPSVRALAQVPLLAVAAGLPGPSAVAVVQPPLLAVTGQLYVPVLTLPGPLQFPVLGVTAALFAPRATAVVRMPTLGVKAWLGVDAQLARPKQPAMARGRGTGRRGGVG